MTVAWFWGTFCLVWGLLLPTKCANSCDPHLEFDSALKSTFAGLTHPKRGPVFTRRSSFASNLYHIPATPVIPNTGLTDHTAQPNKLKLARCLGPKWHPRAFSGGKSPASARLKLRPTSSNSLLSPSFATGNKRRMWHQYANILCQPSILLCKLLTCTGATELVYMSVW